MNILYIAYSCNPFAGSEDKIGWCVPYESSKTNKVYVITKEEQREPVEKYLQSHPLENIKFYYVDIPNFYKKIFKEFMYSGRLNVWNRRVLPLAKKICADQKIDIIHQITPIEFRAIGDYGKIASIKFVCGPLGGGESLPNGLKNYAKGHEIIEVVRSGINRWYRFKLRITGKLNRCDYIMFANKETRDFLGLDENFPLVTEIAADEISIEKRTISNDINDERVFLFAGRMVYRKGLELLFDAIMEIPDEWKYIVKIVGDGPDFLHLKHRCESNSLLSAHVQFMGAVQYSEMQREYELSDVLIMPSIRETTGTVLIEAMSQGMPVITINKFGGAILVDENTGWLYNGENRKSYIDGLKNAMVACIENPKEVERRGQNAREKVKGYTWKRKCNQYEEIYKSLNCVD